MRIHVERPLPDEIWIEVTAVYDTPPARWQISRFPFPASAHRQEIEFWIWDEFNAVLNAANLSTLKERVWSEFTKVRDAGIPT